MKIVNDITARNAIPAGDRTDGMQVTVTSTGGLFVLRGGITNTHWVGPYEWETSANMAIYVNASTGNDTTGTGAVGAPYETITRAHADVPYLLRHAVQIKIAAGTYAEFPQTVEHKCRSGGQFVFDGGGITTDEGPHTVNTATGIGVSAAAQDVNVAPSPAWSVNALAGKYLLIATGVNAGAYYAILSNTADTLRVGASNLLVTAGDTFTIGVPQVTVNLAAGWFGMVDVANQEYPYQMSGIGVGEVRFGLGFINFVSAGGAFTIKDTQAYLPCTTVNFAYFPMNVFNSQINMGDLRNSALAFAAPGANVQMILPFVTKTGQTYFQGAKISGMCTFDALANFDYQSNYLQNSSIGAASKTSYSGGELVFGKVHIRGGHTQYDGFVLVFLSHFEAGANALLLTSSKARVSQCTSANVTAYGLYVDMVSTVEYTTNNILTGATADIYWRQSNTTVGAPAAGAAVTDGQGSFVAVRR